jgi:hypothetical protein
VQQPVPSVSEGDVERVVRRDYSAEQINQVLAALREYGRETWHRERNRVQLAVLKLAAGDLNALHSHLEIAKRDYRDVIAFAEYPGYFTKVPPNAKPSDPAHAEVIDADWKQYQQWLSDNPRQNG